MNLTRALSLQTGDRVTVKSTGASFNVVETEFDATRPFGMNILLDDGNWYKYEDLAVDPPRLS